MPAAMFLDRFKLNLSCFVPYLREPWTSILSKIEEASCRPWLISAVIVLLLLPRSFDNGVDNQVQTQPDGRGGNGARNCEKYLSFKEISKNRGFRGKFPGFPWIRQWQWLLRLWWSKLLRGPTKAYHNMKVRGDDPRHVWPIGVSGTRQVFACHWTEHFFWLKTHVGGAKSERISRDFQKTWHLSRIVNGVLLNYHQLAYPKR